MSDSPLPHSTLSVEELVHLIPRITDPIRLQKILTDNVRTSPQKEEALLKVLYDEPESFSAKQLDVLDYVLMECIQSDQNLCAANAIKEFRASLKRNTKQFFDDLVQIDSFPELILMAHGQEVVLPAALAQQLDPYDSPTYDEINVWLEEMSLKVHLENGKPYQRLVIEKRGTDIILKATGPHEQLTMESYTAEELAKFSEVIRSNDPSCRYQSRYQDIGVKQIAIITHGNPRTLDTLEKVIRNLSQFNHRDVFITVYDDKEDSTLRERIRAVTSPANIKIRYLGWQERQETIGVLTQQLGADKSTGILAAIGPQTGAGGNRNFVALTLGHNNYLSLDDDVTPNVETSISGETKIVPVDFLTIASRHIRPPLFLATDFRYTGHLDNAAMSSVGFFFANNTLSSPINSWRRSYNSSGAAVWDSMREDQATLLYDHRISNVLTGGAACFPSAYNGLISRQPTLTRTRLTGRNQDVFLSVIPQIILDAAGIEPKIFTSAASAMQHNREVTVRNTNLGQNILEELSGQFMSCIVSHLASSTPEVQKAILTGKSPYAQTDLVMTELAKAIADLSSRSEPEAVERLAGMINATIMFIRDVQDLYKMYYYKGVLEYPGDHEMKLAELDAQRRNPTRREAYEKLITDIGGALKDLFASDFERIPSMNERELALVTFKHMIRITKECLQKYGQSLIIWPEMLRAVDAHR